MKPIIGMNGNVILKENKLKTEIHQTYAQAIETAGGIPVLLPLTTDDDVISAQIDLIEGLVLIGGADYDPKLYHSKPHPKTVLQNPARIAYDLKLMKAASQQGLPMLGICAGLQLVNIIRGGTLNQHVPEMSGITEEHSGHLRDDAHDVTIEAMTRLAAIVGKEKLAVNSTHHQAAAHIGRGLRISARSTEGVIEAIESTEPDEFLLCVQWHPERLIDRPRHLAIFQALVEAAKTNR